MNDDIHADQNLRLATKMLDQQGEVNRLQAECAALTDALTATTHDAEGPDGECQRLLFYYDGDPAEPILCGEPADHPVHRTPAVVRAALGTAAP